MKFTDKAIKQISIYGSLIIIIDIALVIFGFVNKDVDIVRGLLITIALGFGLFYSLSGFKKSVADYYKIFLVIYCVASLIDVVTFFFFTNTTEIISNTVYAVVGVRMLTIFCLLILIFVKNLGKGISFNVSLAILLINIILFIMCISEHDNNTYIMAMASLFLSFITLLLVFGKYIDKDKRGAE